jgi:hypothetical protein
MGMSVDKSGDDCGAFTIEFGELAPFRRNIPTRTDPDNVPINNSDCGIIYLSE